MQLNPYLTFQGQARAAMNFYKDCLGGELFFKTVGESPMAESMPDKKDAIIHSILSKDGIVIVAAADDCTDTPFTAGNNVTLCINCTSEEELRGFFGRLSEGAKITLPIREEFWGALFGMLTDKFGIHWMFNFTKSKV